MGAFSFRPMREKLWVVAMVWVRLNLNPHPFKTKRVRHPTADVMEKTSWQWVLRAIFYAIRIARVMVRQLFEREFVGRKL
jgi:hypothetical protein